MPLKEDARGIARYFGQMQIPAIRYRRDTTEFTKTLRARVDAYFKEKNLSRKGNWRLYLKTSIMLTLYFVPWGLVTWGAAGTGVWFWVLEVVMGLGLAGIGLNVMHDANHDAFSQTQWVNVWMGRVLDLVGGNAAIWKIQHNVLHHTFTNVDGLDEDIDMHPFMRFSPLKPRYWWHRFQHIYSWGFYSLMTLFWMIAKDWLQVRRYHKKGLIRPAGTSVGKLSTSLAFTKTAYFTYVILLPMLFSGAAWYQVLAGWVVMQLVAGFILAVIFQPAHVMEDHDYQPAEKGAQLDVDVLTHQLRTTSNFGTGSKVFTWLCGGLNHQIEHHLFPQISHIHLRNIAPIVKKTAEEFGIPYRSSTTYWQAIGKHTRMLRSLGQPLAA